jgi:hypothetical protein
MRKLKLESVKVESFETTPAAAEKRGTLYAHQQHSPISIETYDVEECGETQYFDCSLGCPSIAPCDLTGYECWGA